MLSGAGSRAGRPTYIEGRCLICGRGGGGKVLLNLYPDFLQGLYFLVNMVKAL